MHAPALAPYGTWPSPVTPDLVAGATLSFSELAVDGEAVNWLELRPAEQGRRALVRWTPGDVPRDVLPATADVGTRVHEYGGGAYTVRDGLLVYSERSDNSVRLIGRDGTRRILAGEPDCRYAGFTLDPGRGCVYAVREDHRDRPPTAPENAIVALTLEPHGGRTSDAGRLVAGGSDFVLAPQLSYDGARLAWVAWNQPDMPWDSTRLWVANFGPGSELGEARCIAGAAGGESIAAAAWAPDGRLLFISDRTNWWNVYAWDGAAVEALAPLEAEFCDPPWTVGLRPLVPLDAERILCAFIQAGVVRPGLIAGGSVRELPYGPVAAAPVPFGNGAVYIAAPPNAPAAICHAPRLDDGVHRVVRSAGAAVLGSEDISIGEALTIPTDDGDTTHLFFYPPRNARVAGPPGELPPLVVVSHGGPTAMHTNSLAMSTQWWTSRGFAVASVNYRGSSGFGRAYRERLAGAWGVIDVIDCISAARRLGADGRVDPARIVIRGGSASGMTALLAVATSDVFRAATSSYGVMELEALATDTHKLEARYLDGLVGPLPQARERYHERSPVRRVASIDVPVLLFAGLDDRVVPPSQALMMRDALLARGVPVVYEAFAGEGHGFRKAETLARVLETELAFYRDVFGLTV